MEAAAADILIHRAMWDTGYLRELGIEGITDQFEWAVKEGGERFVFKLGGSAWAALVH